MIQAINSVQPGWAAPTAEPAHWFAAYTYPNHEKRVAAQLNRRGLDYLLPLYDSIRQWKDRKVRLALPLFPGYVFVRFCLGERLRVLEVPGVASLVGFGKDLARLTEEEVRVIQCCTSRESNATPYPYLHVGDRVRVKNGPLSGLEGTIVRSKNCTRLVLSFALFRSSVSVEVGQSDLEPASLNA